jgi:hypothetical protein
VALDIALVPQLRQIPRMTRDAIETAVREGIPFAINMADGRQYMVTDKSKIAWGATRVVVLDERDLPHVLPLLTMTGISYLPKENGSAQS